MAAADCQTGPQLAFLALLEPFFRAGRAKAAPNWHFRTIFEKGAMAIAVGGWYTAR